MNVSSDILRVYKSLHTWTGLLAGMALFICFYAGAVTMFAPELDRWASRPSTQLAPVDAAQLPALIQAVITQHPEAAHDLSVHLRPGQDTPASLTWTPHANHHSRLPDAPAYFGATLDADGQLQVAQFRPTPVGALVNLLHQTAGLPGRGKADYFGITFMGVVSVLYALALVSGLILLLPTLVSDFFAIRPGRNLKRLWLDVHNVLGIASLPFHLLIAWTAVAFAFHDIGYDSLQKVVYGDQPVLSRPAAGPAPAPEQTLLPPQELEQRLHAIAPDFTVHDLQFLNLGSAKAQVRMIGSDPHYPHRMWREGFAVLNPYSGQMIQSDYLPGQQKGWIVPVTALFSLHFGNFGGAFGLWSYFFLGLAGAFVFYSGNLLWVESRRRKQKRQQPEVIQPRNTRLMAAGTVGVCCGAMLGISASLAASKWLVILGDELMRGHMAVYYLCFLGSVAWAFIAGAGRAAVHLLNLCAIATALIAATDLLAWLVPALPLWLYPEPSLLLIDVVAIIAAVCFAWMARRTAHRLRHGQSDSVWAGPATAEATATTAGAG